MLVITTFNAPDPPKRRLRKARPKPADGSEASAVALTALTAVRTEHLGDEPAAATWLEQMADDEDARDAEVAAALVLVNTAIHAHRVAALDGHLPYISAAHALAVRIGYGDGDGLVDGKWEAAIELPRGARRKRAEMLAPQEKVAAFLGGREAADAATAAILRARVDLEGARTRDGALQLRIGLEAMLADREAFGSSGQEEDLATLDARRTVTGEAANEALKGELSAERAAEVEETLSVAERVLRRRRAYG